MQATAGATKTRLQRRSEHQVHSKPFALQILHLLGDILSALIGGSEKLDSGWPHNHFSIKCHSLLLSIISYFFPALDPVFACSKPNAAATKAAGVKTEEGSGSQCDGWSLKITKSFWVHLFNRALQKIYEQQ